jgi:hypothetical protein
MSHPQRRHGDWDCPRNTARCNDPFVFASKDACRCGCPNPHRFPEEHREYMDGHNAENDDDDAARHEQEPLIDSVTEENVQALVQDYDIERYYAIIMLSLANNNLGAVLQKVRAMREAGA